MTLPPMAKRAASAAVPAALRTRAVCWMHTVARKLLGWPKISKLAHTFLWEHSYKRLKMAELGVFLTCVRTSSLWLRPL